MSAFKTPLFILNPRSGGGLTPRRLREIELAIKAAFPSAKLRRTEFPRHAKKLAIEAAEGGHDLVGVVGGDGTVSEVVNGLMSLEPARRPALGVIPTGTGCDLVKSIDIPKDVDAAIQRLVTPRIVAVDVGEILCRCLDDNTPMTYYFLNIAGFGANGEVVNRVNQSSKALGGFISFAKATVSTVFTYPGAKVNLKVDGQDRGEKHLHAFFVANAQYQGGGMRTGLGASMNDGRFNFMSVTQKSSLKIVAQVGKLYSGEVDEVPWIDTGRAKQIEVTPVGNDRVLIEADGEQPGMLPATFTVVDEALKLCVGPHPIAI